MNILKTSSSKKECANIFIHEIIWYNPNWNEESIELKRISEKFDNVNTYEDCNKCLTYLQEAETSIQFIISGISIEDIQVLFKKIMDRNIKSVSDIYVYSCKVENQIKSLMNDFTIFNFIQNFNDLLLTISKNILKINFPQLKVYDKLTDHNYESTYNSWEKTLEKFKNFTKLKLCSNKNYQIYSENKIQSFMKDQSQYSARKILSWYANDSFLRRIFNFWSKNSFLMSFIISNLDLDLIRVAVYNAVKEKSKEQKTKYSGILYSEIIFDENQWKSIQKKVGRDIVIDSFLPASKNKDYYIHFNKQDMVFVTIILPGFRGEWQNSFVDLTEFSDDSNQQEILFNALSEFRILEAYIQRSERHLVLLYEANTLRKFMKLNQTALSFVKNPWDLKCNVCDLNISDNALVYIQLHNFDNICKNCLGKYQVDNNYPLLRTNSSNLKSEQFFESDSYIEIPGILMKYDKLCKLPFYGYKCVKCNITASSYYTCLKCSPLSLSDISQEKDKYDEEYDSTDYPYEYYNCLRYPKPITICEECASQTCFKNNHPLILETYPYTFWSETISEKEYNELKTFQVGDSEDYLHNLSEKYKDYVDEEIDMKDSIDKIVRLLVSEIVWYEPGCCEKKIEEHKKKLENLVKKININFFNQPNKALDYIRKVERFVQVIVSGNNFEQFVQDVLDIKNVKCVYVPGKQPKKDKIIFYDDYEGLENKVKVNVRRVEFPVFSLLSDSDNKTRMRKLHAYLNSTQFRNEEKSKEYFLNLAREIYFTKKTN